MKYAHSLLTAAYFSLAVCFYFIGRCFVGKKYELLGREGFLSEERARQFHRTMAQLFSRA